MTRSIGFKVGIGIAIALAGIQQAGAQAPTLAVDPSRLPRLGTIDARFQSYNVEMVEVTGGRFWKPYGSARRRRIAALTLPGISRRAAIPISSRIGSLSTCRTRGCAYWLPHWRRPTCASAAPGPTAPILQKATRRPPRRPAASARCSAASAGRASSTLPVPPAPRSLPRWPRAPAPGTRRVTGRAIRRVACSLIAKPLAEELPPPSS